LPASSSATDSKSEAIGRRFAVIAFWAGGGSWRSAYNESGHRRQTLSTATVPRLT
jgi:hypothetical protein